MDSDEATALRRQRRRERNQRYQERLKVRRAGHNEANHAITPTEDAEAARRRQLRKERNRRYQERLKQRRAGQAGPTQATNSLASVTSEDGSNDNHATGHTSRPRHHAGQSTPGRKTRGPIHIYRSPVRSYVTRLRSLNDRLVAWGYTKKTLKFGRKVGDEYSEVAASDATMQADWVAKKKSWIAEGDRILDYVEDFVSEDLLDYSAEQSMVEHWRNLSSVAFNVTYMMAITQARVDMV